MSTLDNAAAKINKLLGMYGQTLVILVVQLNL